MSDVVVEARGLSKSFAGFFAVQNVDIKVRRGTIHSIIGPNGAGKTTVFNLLTKFLPPTAGQIFYRGRDVTRMPPAALARDGMVRSFQISAVFAPVTVLENVRIALQRPHGGSYRFWRSERRLHALHGRAEELLDRVGLTDVRDVPAAELPYGRKRVLELATTLALEPELLLLDEPTSGLGHEDVGRIAELIREVSASRTTVMIEHNLSVVAELSDTITVLARGQVLVEGDYATVSSHPAVMEAYMGTGGDDDPEAGAHG